MRLLEWMKLTGFVDTSNLDKYLRFVSLSRLAPWGPELRQTQAGAEKEEGEKKKRLSSKVFVLESSPERVKEKL